MHKFYTNGIDFINENIDLLNSSLIETAFFKKNAQSMKGLNRKSYIFKVYQDNMILLCLKYDKYPLLLFGNVELCDEAARIVYQYHLEINKVQARSILAESFLRAYEEYFDGYHSTLVSMELMTCKDTTFIPSMWVERGHVEYIDELTNIYLSFHKEIFNEEYSYEYMKNRVENELENIRLLKVNNEVVAMAKRVIGEDAVCPISMVYTKPEYRGKGYAKEVVGVVTKDILNKNKLPYLYVDKANPISNKLYSSLGFKYEFGIDSVKYEEKNLKTAIFAGGCFWCMSKPYYEYDGIYYVYSGYAGGSEVDPTYEEVKKGKTSHREAIMIVYNPKIISYDKLINIYFNTINPFDGGGQYIDRGFNYTCAIFTDNEDEIKVCKEKINKLEEEFNQKTFVPILEEPVFYMAEEYHQDYAIKNPKEMEIEWISSGRN